MWRLKLCCNYKLLKVTEPWNSHFSDVVQAEVSGLLTFSYGKRMKFPLFSKILNISASSERSPYVSRAETWFAIFFQYSEASRCHYLFSPEDSFINLLTHMGFLVSCVK